jgi:hypothetical protein
MNFINYIGSYLTFQEIMDRKSNKQNIEQLIEENKNIGRLLPILSQLASIKPRQSNYKLFKNDVRLQFHIMFESLEKKGHPSVLINQFKAKLDKLLLEREVISTQGVLFVWKYILAKGSPEYEIILDSFADDYIKSLSMTVMLSDHLDNSNKDTLTKVFQSYMFYSHGDFSSSLARTLLIYTQIAKDKEQYKNEYLDFEAVFIEKYGCSLTDYIFVLFGIYTLFLIKIPEDKTITPDWFQSISKAFEPTTLKDSVSSILYPLIFTFEDAQKELKDSYEDPWDYRFFSRKPLFNIKDDIVFPVSLTLLENTFHEGLYWKIRDCFPQEGNVFQSFFGRPFEIYAQNLIKSSAEKSSIYELIEEFTYSRSSKRSPDIMLRLGTKLLAIETKAQRLNYKKSVVEGDINSIETDRVKMTVKPIKQIYTRLNELINGESNKVDFSKIDEIFVIVVNQGEFPLLKPLHQKTKKDWKELSGIKVKVHFDVLSIDELEYLSSVIERDRPVFRVLKHRTNFVDIPFKHFVTKQFSHLTFPSALKKAQEELLNKLSDNKFLEE